MDALGNEVGPAPLELERSSDGHGRVCLAVAGEVDISNLDRLHQTILAILAEPSVSTLTLDFQGLDFIDSSGVEIVMKAKQLADTSGVGLYLVNAHGKVLRVLSILGIDKVLAPSEEPRPQSPPAM